MSSVAINSFRDLDVWQVSMALALDCYKLTNRFPDTERYGMVSQMRRAAVSIPSNVAEGHVRPTSVYRNHVSIALGSRAELETVVELALRLQFVTTDDAAAVVSGLDRVGRMLNRLSESLRRRALERRQE